MRVAGEADAKDLWGRWRWDAWAAAAARVRPHPPHQDRLWAPPAAQLIRPPTQDSQVPKVTHILARAFGASTMQRKSDICTSRKEAVWNQFQFPYSCICERNKQTAGGNR